LNAVIRAAVVATSIALFAAGSVSAQAVEVPVLPANQHLFVVDCDRFYGQLWNIDSTNGFATAVGDQPVSDPYCVGGTHVNPLDGKVYAIIYTSSGNGLYTYDTSTGDSTFIALLSGDASQGRSLVITNSGEAFLHSDSGLFAIDLNTAVTTFVGNMGFGVQAIAYNSADDTIYAFKRMIGDVHSVDRATGALTYEVDHQLTFPEVRTCLEGPVFSFQLDMAAFDSNGNLWIHSESCVRGELSVADFTTGIVTTQGQFTDAARAKYTNAPHYNFYAPTILITTDVVEQEDEPLADTGGSAETSGALWGIATIILTVAFALRIGLRRRDAQR